MGSIIDFFNTVWEIIKDLVSGFVEFINTIPLLFENENQWIGQLIPMDLVNYISVFIVIATVLLTLRFAIKR